MCLAQWGHGPLTHALTHVWPNGLMAHWAKNKPNGIPKGFTLELIGHQTQQQTAVGALFSFVASWA